MRQIGRQCAHVPGNGHFVVVQHDKQLRGAAARIVERLIAQAARHRAVSHQRHDRIVIILQVPGAREAERRGDGCGSMPGFKYVVFAFGAFGEAGHPAFGAQRLRQGLPPREQLVGIALMPHVENDFVLRRTEHAVQRER